MLGCALSHPSVLRDKGLLERKSPHGKDTSPVGVEANGRVIHVFAQGAHQVIVALQEVSLLNRVMKPEQDRASDRLTCPP